MRYLRKRLLSIQQHNTKVFHELKKKIALLLTYILYHNI